MKRWVGNLLQALDMIVSVCIVVFSEKLVPEQYMIITVGAFSVFCVIELCKEKEVKTPKEQLKDFEKNINEIPLIIDPCKMCKIYKEKMLLDKALSRNTNSKCEVAND